MGSGRSMVCVMFEYFRHMQPIYYHNGKCLTHFTFCSTVWAAGNELTTGVDVNGDGIVNSRYTISVGATDQRGYHASYSTPGAALLISAPGGDSNDFLSQNSVAKPTGLGGGCVS